MRISLLLITVALLALLGPGCALPEAARTAPPTAQQTPPAMPPSSPPPLSRSAPIAISTPTVRRTPSAPPSVPPTWQTTDRGSRTLRIEPIGAVAVETVPPPPPVPPAPADDLGAPPTGPLPLPMVR